MRLATLRGLLGPSGRLRSVQTGPRLHPPVTMERSGFGMRIRTVRTSRSEWPHRQDPGDRFGPQSLLASAGDDHSPSVRLAEQDSARDIGRTGEGGWSAWHGLRRTAVPSPRRRRRNSFLWKVEDRSPLKPLRGHVKHVHGLAFFPDGKTLASGCGRKSAAVGLDHRYADREPLDRSASHPYPRHHFRWDHASRCGKWDRGSSLGIPLPLGIAGNRRARMARRSRVCRGQSDTCSCP